MFVVAAAATAEPETAKAEVASPAAAAAAGPSSVQLAEPAAAAAAEGPLRARGGSKWVIDENEVLHSTLEHRAWTYGCLALLAGGLGEAASNVHSLQDAAVVGGAVFAAYVLSDLGTAVFHHAVDNYGECAAVEVARFSSGGACSCRCGRWVVAAALKGGRWMLSGVTCLLYLRAGSVPKNATAAVILLAVVLGRSEFSVLQAGAWYLTTAL
jgi:hypothetical protein